MPLWGRAVETRKKKPLLVDTVAVEIIKNIDYDFTTIAANINPITQLAWIARSLHIDRAVREFLGNHPRGTIVNIGCGLDTTFERVDNGTLLWYDLDLPDVIALRKQFVPDNERRSHIACSFLNDVWFSELKVHDSIMFIVAGVFYYFEEEQMKEFLPNLARRFPGGEIIFDVASPLGVRTANKRVLKAGGMEEGAILKWGIENAQEIRSWDIRIVVADGYPMFFGVKRRLGLKTKIGAALSDWLKIMSIVRLTFQQ